MRRLLIGLFALAMLAAAPVSPQPAGGQGYSQEQLDALLAPVALYPDQLLMQVLIAATYPLEVIEAVRFVQQNPDLRGEALDAALAAKDWDPSVQSLAAFPSVLVMMSDRLEWMQQLGDAFLVDQSRVMDTVQALRARAEATGNLESTPQQSVVTQDGEISIEPAQPDVVYVPVYNPFFVYGPWWAPDYLPWFWYPPPIYGYPDGGGITTGIFFGTAWTISRPHWGWAHPDWRRRHVSVNTTGNRFWNRPGRPPPSPGGTWQHEPAHRRGVAYPNTATYGRYIGVDPNAVRARQDYRGHDLTQPAPGAARPSFNVARPAPNTVQPPTSGVQLGPNGVQLGPNGVQLGPSGAQLPSNVTRLPPGEVRPAPNVVRGAPGGTLAMPPAPRPQPHPPAPVFDPGLSRQQAQINAQRGLESRQTIVPAPAAGTRAPSSAPAPRSGARQR